jgi:hypothetical protein
MPLDLLAEDAIEDDTDKKTPPWDLHHPRRD